MNPQEKDAMERYLARATGRTREGRRGYLVRWARHLEGLGLGLLDADRQVIEEYLAARIEEGLRPRTVGGILSHLRGWYRWAHQERLIDADPTEHIRGPRRGHAAARAWLGWADLARLLAVARDHYPVEVAAMVHLWALSGLRPGEPLRLDVRDLGRSEGRAVLRVTATKTPGQDRVILPEVTAQLLAQCAAGRKRGPLLRNPRARDGLWHPPAVQATMRRLCDRAGVARVSPYGLRVSFVTLSLDAGIPAREVMISSRHASYAMTEHYDRLRVQQLYPVGPRLADELARRHPETAASAAAATPATTTAAPRVAEVAAPRAERARPARPGRHEQAQSRWARAAARAAAWLPGSTPRAARR